MILFALASENEEGEEKKKKIVFRHVSTNTLAGGSEMPVEMRCSHPWRPYPDSGSGSGSGVAAVR